ncbi:bifunctional lysine-specific demethylase and histidyl-hydroxylase NO66 [Maniola jurtina]|uniref:bifunctional lysine-specific demethylase and histidyl-hydroxylase NO66 n=1 Tax=Maniola jurtina TaxID=191418 RepID=UPI001E68E99E|nr:bifunctional lysine-specific demethylase and histidyl-hydroxylase NO66 [Maniola jurtina]
MESPVSAFAVYNANKKEPKKKRNRRRGKTATSPKVLKDVGDDQMKEIGLKLKRKQKKQKELKNISKKKLHKKKKSKKDSKVSIQKEVRNRKSPESVDEHVPQLLRAPLKKQIEVPEYDRSPSQSSNNSFDFTPVQTDSSEEGLKVFKWMIAPFSPEDFLNQIWEKKPLHIARNKSRYYNEIISTPLIDSMLRNENIQFTKNIDITSYVDGKRETHNPEGRAHPHLVWDFYLNGCSIRLLNPQTYISQLHLLNATLQEFFHSFVGANAYLTPPDSQGFAPHYDDIEAFILQAEGKKHWRIYKPRDILETLPRTSSKNFTDDEIGEPILEVTLEAGDMLYFPRGYIHQGVTIDGEHSLHVTISMYQKHAWADLFEKMIPAALQMAINENVELRKGLPFDIYDNFGLVHSDVKTSRKTEIEQLVKNLFNNIQNYLPIDEAVDQMSKKFQQDALPPVLTDLEKAVTVYGDTDVMVENGKVTNRVEISLDTRIRLLRKNILRMVSEERIRLYYYVENSLEYHGNELPYLEIEEDLAPAIDTLINSYPEYVSVENLDVPNETDKLQIADALWSRGLIMTEYPLENIDDD